MELKDIKLELNWLSIDFSLIINWLDSRLKFRFCNFIEFDID